MRTSFRVAVGLLATCTLGACGKAGNRLLLGTAAKAAGEVSIAIEPLAKLDGKSRDEVFSLRKEKIMLHPELARPDYAPSEEVFALVEDGAPWWGLEGIYFYSSGPRSTEGPSEQSRFLLNPYLLVALKEPLSWQMDKPDGAADYYPRPTSLSWNAKAAAIRAAYNVSNHFDFLAKYNYPHPEGAERQLVLVGYNARDWGFHYLYLDPESSANAAMAQETGQPVEIRQYLHKGGSCGYGRGCNNMSPYQADLFMRVATVPATATIKLWKEKPQSVKTAADATVTLEML